MRKAAKHAHLVDRWEKRNRMAVRNYDPTEADIELLASLFERYGADYPHRFYTEANPRFFEGTEVARKLATAVA